MSTVDLCARIKEATHLVLDSAGEGIGTAVCASEDGFWLTAAHILPEADEAMFAQIRAEQGVRSEPLVSLLSGIAIDNEFFRRPLRVDLATLRAANRDSRFPFLQLAPRLCRAGESVLMAGYSDEMELPLAFGEALDGAHPDVKSQVSKLKRLQHQLMIKSGMIGHVSEVTMTDDVSGLALKGAVYWIDNSLHSGACCTNPVSSTVELSGKLAQP